MVEGMTRGQVISIHALRGEGDRAPIPLLPFRWYFYPRPPWGGRPSYCSRLTLPSLFLSTPSVGRATPPPCWRTETAKHFYPRPPWGGRLLLIKRVKAAFEFLSTPSVGRATLYSDMVCQAGFISIHALRGEGDHRGRKREPVYHISIHALRGEGDGLVQPEISLN